MLEAFPTIVLENWYLLPAFFCVAVLYSSVGFGGGSSYLAILAMSGIEFRTLRAIALLCNIIVVAGGVYIFFHNGYLRFWKAFPLILASMPLAFLGGRTQLTQEAFFPLLGSVLVVAAILLWLQPINKIRDRKSADCGIPKDLNLETAHEPTQERPRQVVSTISGSLIGFLSGTVGIGGGIFLSPTLNLMRWDQAKVISATASLFILVNSVSGLLGQSTQSSFQLNWSLALALMICVFLGGQIGSRLGAKILPAHIVRKLTAILVLFVGLKQFFR